MATRRIKDLIGPRGGNWAWMMKNSKLIGEFIKVNGLRPSAITHVEIGTEMRAKRGPDLGIAGGIRLAHLHFGNRIYMLNPAQWTRFSAAIIADSRARLAKVKQVDFEQGMLLGSVMETLAP